MPTHSRIAGHSHEPPSAIASPLPQSAAAYAEVGSLSGSPSCDSSAQVSDVPTSDPPSSTGKRPHHSHQLPAQSQPAKKTRLSDQQREATIAAAISSILDCLDDNPLREGLRKTPTRYAKALLSLTDGYRKSVEEVMGDAEFDENHSEVVLIRNIDVFSLCEHHLLPFYGSVHVAYIPSGPVIGLSKIARIVDVFARRFQVQERLTSQIADAVETATKAAGVMVYITCSHMCMAMRGVQKVGAETTTTAARGRYKEESDLRRDFLTIVRRGGSDL